MTVSSESYRQSYTGNGSTTAFSIPFLFYNSTHIVVTRRTISTGVEETLSSGFTITGAGNEAGGTCTFTTAPTSDHTITFTRDVPLTQTTDYESNTGFPADSHEQAVDLYVMIAQQLQEIIDRCAKTQVSDSSGPTFDTLSDLDAKYLYMSGSTITGRALTTTSTDYSGAFDTGLDAAKAASPSVGDLYFAYDTNKFYRCISAGSWSFAFNADDLAVSGDLTVTGGAQVTGILTGSNITASLGLNVLAGNNQIKGQLSLANGGAVNEFSTDGTMAGNSNTAIPTEAALVTYLAAQLTDIVGTFVDKSASYGAQQASTALLIFGSLSDDASTYLAELFTDSNSNPTTKVGQVGNLTTYNSSSNKKMFFMVVKKSNYWKMVLTTGSPTINYLWAVPLGA